MRVIPEVIAIGNRGLVSNNPSEPVSSSSSNSVMPINSSTNFDPSDPFWAFLLGLSPVRGTTGGAS